MSESQTVTESDLIEVLDENGGLRIEEIAAELDVDFREAREAVHNLWEDHKLVAGPNFEFELSHPRSEYDE